MRVTTSVVFQLWNEARGTRLEVKRERYSGNVAPEQLHLWEEGVELQWVSASGGGSDTDRVTFGPKAAPAVLSALRKRKPGKTIIIGVNDDKETLYVSDYLEDDTQTEIFWANEHDEAQNGIVIPGPMVKPLAQALDRLLKFKL